MHLAKLSQFSKWSAASKLHIYISMTAAWFCHLKDTSILLQHSGIGGFGKWDGLVILYHGLIKYHYTA